MRDVAAGFIIFRQIKHDIQYLFLQTSYGRHHWTPPKGHTDEGESELQAAYRETEEEAGLRKCDLKLYDFQRTLRYPVRRVEKRVVYWLAEVDQSCVVKLSEEHQDYRWLNMNDLMPLISEYIDMQDIVREANTHIQATLGSS